MILACLCLPAVSGANEVEKSFETTLKLAAHRASKFDSNEHNIENYKGIKSVTYHSSFKWEVIVQGNWGIGSQYTRGIVEMAAYFEVNPEGNGFTYGMPLQDIPTGLEKAFYDKKDVKKAWEHADKKLSGMGMTSSIGREGDVTVFRAASDNSGKLGTKLQRTMEVSRRLLSTTGKELRSVSEEAEKNLVDGKLNGLTTAQAEKLLSLDHGYYVEGTELEGGEWSIRKTSSNTLIDVENREGEVVFYISREFPDDSEDRRAERVEKIAGFLKKNSVDSAHSSEALLFPGFPTFVSTKLVFKLDGSKKGKDLTKCFKEIRQKFHKKVGKVLDES